jgi:hypothetical protein
MLPENNSAAAAMTAMTASAARSARSRAVEFSSASDRKGTPLAS